METAPWRCRLKRWCFSGWSLGIKLANDFLKTLTWTVLQLFRRSRRVFFCLQFIARALENWKARVFGISPVRRRAEALVKDRTPIGAHKLHVPTEDAKADLLIFRRVGGHRKTVVSYQFSVTA